MQVTVEEGSVKPAQASFSRENAGKTATSGRFLPQCDAAVRVVEAKANGVPHPCSEQGHETPSLNSLSAPGELATVKERTPGGVSVLAAGRMGWDPSSGWRAETYARVGLRLALAASIARATASKLAGSASPIALARGSCASDAAR